MTFHATIQTPMKTLFDGEADFVRASTDLGKMEIYPDHATLVGTALYSIVDVHHGNVQETFVIRQGSVCVHDDGHVTILAHEASKKEEMNVQSVEDYLKYVVEQMETGDLNEYQMQFLQERREALEKQREDSE